ncbi:unnamed protein product [Soboliphyme baturini]|uniref:Aa_trans domain-containing protein n=1 Tax=Soboliphyme baturini TaxID=241478 RepID=A0A183J9V5_9BILA|nr:unnamed protein product [Soboliphyme baturini]
MVAVAYICYYTGLILVECLYDDDGSRARQSYRAIAEHCWGSTWAGRLVLGAQMLELLMTCILYVVICGDLLESSFSSATINKMGWMLLCTALLIPCAFIENLVVVSKLSFWNTVSHVIINLIVIAYCFTEVSSWSLSSIKFTFDIKIFPTVLGIIVFSYTSHIFLPTLEYGMKDRSQFKPMLMYSHLFAALFKALFAIVGYLTFDDFTQEEVTNNLPSQSFKIVINIILVIKALLSYPLPYYAIVDLLTNEYFRGRPLSKFPVCFSPDGSLREWALAMRICIVLFILFMAISIPHFALLMGLVGNITGTMLSFIWPSIFHLQMKRHLLPKYKLWLDVSVICIGAIFCLSGLFYSSMGLHRAIHYPNEYL